jgi:hypothetical protein
LSLNTTSGDVQATAAEKEETITVAEEEVIDQTDETEAEAEEGVGLSPGAPPIG